jgi:addiction module RelE/StbE family toxin
MATRKTHYRVIWKAAARRDLIGIIRYIGKDNPARARSFGQELSDKALVLADHPMSGRPGRPGLPEGTRELVAHANYIIFYRVQDIQQRIVEILRVRHVALRFPF